MPFDICMCLGGDCPQKEHCLRFTGTVYGRQDFFGTPPYISDTKHCDYFMDDRPSHALIRQQAYLFWQQEGCPDGKGVDNWLRAEAYLLELRRKSG